MLRPDVSSAPRSSAAAPAPLVREIAWIAPQEAAARLRGAGKLAFLDSAMPHARLGRYSYVAADPFGCFRVSGGQARWNDAPVAGPPLSAFAALLARHRRAHVPDLPPFQGGACGYFAYEFGGLLEHLPQADVPPQGAMADAAFHFYDAVAAFDHESRRAWIVSSGASYIDDEQRRVHAEARANAVEAQLAQPSPHTRAVSAIARGQWRSNFTRESYTAAVRAVIDAILAGDIFQANISQRFTADLPADYDPWAFYLRLRTDNPAPFAAYLDDGENVIASSSPERFLRVTGTQVETRPIKGTIARAPSAQEDRARAQALLGSEKDRAENLMIVDLLRNDLSRVCLAHSVKTPALCALETYAGVHHLVSEVTGELAPGRTALDLIAAAFPGGSVTGAPKLRAMEIITAIERMQRGIYCGAIGFFGFDGACDTNIAIRTVLLRNGSASFQAGGGVTALSDPESEYRETLDKAERVFRAFAALRAGDAA